MKCIHLSDLHIGKKVNEFSMLEDQAYILTKIINIIDEQNVETVFIAGDVYDKSVPPIDAVNLFDDFLVRLSKRNLKVFIISGNHDSAERLAFGGRLMNQSGIYVSPLYHGDIQPITIQDEYGDLNVYLLPFIKPAHVRHSLEIEVSSYNEAVEQAINHMNIDTTKRNVLLAHQFVTGAIRSDSEEISVGGSDNIDAHLFKEFDYVALGHIHRPQKCIYDYIRYSGTPLKYSFSEANHHKSVTIINIQEKGNLSIEQIPLIPKRDMVELKGTYNELVAKSFYEHTTYQEDYVHITLTDEEDILDALAKLRVIYKNIMKLDYDNQRTRHQSELSLSDAVEEKTPYEHFSDFYEMMNGQSLNDEQSAFMQQLIESIWGD
ncbi:MAG: exonuclease SbcCD subunit D [Longicatena sp.]|nr:exonuclease SbcCD subunit D [Longicatena sp.]